MGRRRIEIERIQNKNARYVCFSKRRKGLFKKIDEFRSLFDNIHVLCIVFSPAGKPFVSGDPGLIRDHDLLPPSTSASETESSRPTSVDVIDDDLEYISGLSLSELEEYSVALEKMRASLINKLPMIEIPPSDINEDDLWNLLDGQPRMEAAPEITPEAEDPLYPFEEWLRQQEIRDVENCVAREIEPILEGISFTSTSSNSDVVDLIRSNEYEEAAVAAAVIGYGGGEDYADDLYGLLGDYNSCCNSYCL